MIEVCDQGHGSASGRAGEVTLARLAVPFPRSGLLRRAGLAHRPSELVGRDRDLTVVRAFVHGLSNQGGSLRLLGEPGVGKSAVLDAADGIAATAGTRALRAAGAESEVASFSGLNQLLLPLRVDFSRLDALQRSALNAALGFSAGFSAGFSDGSAGDLLVLPNAVLALLSQAAEDRPLLLIVDNLHRLDQASAQILGFVARRLTGSRVGLLTAEQTESARPADPDAPGYELMPLDDDAATRLVADGFPDLAPAVRQRIVTEAGGNPLALLELPAGLTDRQRSARAALPAILPLTRRLRAALIPRVSALSAPGRYLLLLAALDGAAGLNLLRGATTGPGVIEELAQAEQAGLVQVDEATGHVVFSNPLIRSAVVEMSSSSNVRRAHLALAARLRDQPERRAWHLAAAAIAPDEGVADHLDQVAHQMQAGGDASQAVAALIRAAQLSLHHRDRSRRLAEAACLSATVTGELAMVPQLLAEARHAALEPDRSLGPDASLHGAVAEAWLLLNAAADIDAVHRLLTGALRATQAAPRIGSKPVAQQASDAGLIVALQTLLVVCAAGGRAELWQPFETALADLAPGDRAELELLARTHGDPARSAVGILGQLDAAIADLSGSTERWRVLVLGAAAARTDRLAGCREALWHLTHDGGESGPTLPAISAMTLLCHDGFQTGAWDEAWQMAEECLRACQRHGHPARAWMAREHLAMIAAARGDDDLMRELTTEMLQWAMPRGITLAHMSVRQAGALAALGRGDFEEAYREAAGISPAGVFASHVPHALWAVMDLVEAAVRTGRLREATDHVAAARRAGIAEISPRLALLVTASSALAAPAGEAGQIFERALGIHGADRWPFEFARVQLAFGEHLRRCRAPSDARVHLAAALASFRTLRARPWSERAANELRAARLTPTRLQTSQAPALTAQERQIVALAAAGLTNKQIGQRLYLSPRTVGSHLYRVFPKLGVSSRAGLRDALLALGSGDSARDQALTHSVAAPAG